MQGRTVSVRDARGRHARLACRAAITRASAAPSAGTRGPPRATERVLGTVHDTVRAAHELRAWIQDRVVAPRLCACGTADTHRATDAADAADTHRATDTHRAGSAANAHRPAAWHAHRTSGRPVNGPAPVTRSTTASAVTAGSSPTLSGRER